MANKICCAPPPCNCEFKQAAKLTKAKLEGYKLEEVDFFMENFVLPYKLPLDNLLQ